MKALCFGRKLRRLVPNEFESKLLGTGMFTKQAGGWVDEAKEHGVFFDLSRVEWVDLGALVPLILLVESALRAGVAVSVALPLCRRRSSEEAYVQANPQFRSGVDSRAERRKKAYDYLQYLRFEHALRAEHLCVLPGKITVLKDYDESTAASDQISVEEPDQIGLGDESESEDKQDHEYEYKLTFPLTWLSASNPQEVKALAGFLAGVLAERSRGLKAVDADTLRNVILHELVDNVSEYAETTSHALVAAWARPETCPPRVGDAGLFSAGDFKDLSGFVTKLRVHRDPVSDHLWNQFPEPTRQALADLHSPPEQQQSGLVAALNNLLKGNLIYETGRFAQVTISSTARALISQDPQGEDLIRLNRLLIQDAYPKEIAKIRGSDYTECEKPYLEWLAQKQVPTVEIVFGDSGVGVIKKLCSAYDEALNRREIIPLEDESESANILLWSFERWSTSRNKDSKRGTRGLYRVDRIVKKYQGLVLMRSDTQLVGWDHGGPSYNRPVVERKRLNLVPGTVLRLWLPAFHDRLLARQTPSPTRKPQTSVLAIGLLGENGIEEKFLEQLRRLSGGVQDHVHPYILAFFEGGVPTRENIERAVRQCAEVGHPGRLILAGIPGGWSLVETAVDSVNEEHERERRGYEMPAPDHYEVWAPVLVVGWSSGLEFAWAGADAPLRTVLHALLLSGGKLPQSEIHKLLPSPGERTALAMALQTEEGLARTTDAGGLESCFGSLEDFIHRSVSDSLGDYVQKQNDGVRFAGGVFRTPTLHLVKKWIDVSTVLRKTVGPELALLALSTKINQHFGKRTQPDFIISESITQPRHLSILCEYRECPAPFSDPE